MIDSLHIKDYRSCRSTAFQLQPDLSVLIGPNGSGKTTVINAILLLRALSQEDNNWTRENEELTNDCEIKTGFRIADKKATLTAKVQLVTDDHNADSIIRSNESWYAKDFTGNSKRIKIPLSIARRLDPDGQWRFPVSRTQMSRSDFQRLSLFHFGSGYSIPDEFSPTLSSIAKFLKDIKYYSASQFTNPSTCPVSFELEKEGRYRRGVRIRGHSAFLYDLYTARKTDGYAEFFNVIGPAGIGLVNKIEFTELATSSIDYTVRSGGNARQLKREKILVVPRFIIGKNVLSPSQLSEGTFKTITLLFYLMTEKSSALIIEEPEVCVHHGLLASIVELIKTYSKHKQIVISTHSDFVLDQIEPRHVYKVTRTLEEGTKVTQIARSLSHQELAALKSYLESEGNLGEYWRHGGFE